MADTLSSTNVGKLLDQLASYHDDPLGFVMWAFPWGEPGTPLEDMTGPEDWQRAQLTRMADSVRKGGIEGCVHQEDVAAGHGVGKAHPVGMLLDTPAGRKRWGDLRAGDTVFAADGTPACILATRHYETAPLYRVTFDDGSFCDVSSGHLWSVRGRQERRKNIDGWRTLETLDLLRLGVFSPAGTCPARQWEIPTQQPVQYPHADLPMEPYLLGMWLGNGHEARITQPQCPELRWYAGQHGISWSPAPDRAADVWSLAGTRSVLRDLDLFSTRSWEKFIPAAYHQASVEQRKALLAGLMDTDGTADKRGSCVYDTTSERLAADVMSLVRSLGGKAQLQPTVKRPFYRDDTGEKVFCRDCYRVTVWLPFNPFRRAVKGERWRECQPRYLKRWIDSIEPLPAGPAMCIAIDRADGLYQANDFIVTHNSAIVSWLILWAISTHANTRGVVTANTDSQLRLKTWAELGKWHQLFIARKLFRLTATGVFIDGDEDLAKTWRIDAVPWTKERSEAFAGLHNAGRRILVVFDEASAIDDVIWEVTEGALTDARTQIFWMRYGNPTKTSGRFFKNVTTPRTNIVTKVDSRDVSFSNKQQIQAWVDEYGEDSDFVRVRVRGMFPRAGSSNFISPELVFNARRRRIPERDYIAHPKILAVDPARFGDDFSVVTLRQGLKIHYQVAFQGFDGPDLAGRVFELVRKETGVACIVYDAAGNGADLDSSLRRMPGLPQLVPISWGVPAADSKSYFNQRSEAWGKLREWLEHGEIPDNDTLAEELTSLDYGYDVRFRIQLQSKKDAKKNGGKSPDHADSAALTMLPDLITLGVRTAKVRPVKRRQVIWSR